MWQEAHAMFFSAEMFTSKFINLPRAATAALPEPCWVGGCPVTVVGGNAFASASACWKMDWTSPRTRAVSDSISAGMMPDGYGLYVGGLAGSAAFAPEQDTSSSGTATTAHVCSNTLIKVLWSPLRR